MTPHRLASCVAALAVGLGAAACANVRDPPPDSPEQAGLASATPSSSLDSVIAQGQDLYDQGEFDAARSIWQPALVRARDDSDARNEARLLTSLGLAARQLGEPGEAQRLGEAAVALELRHDLTDLLPRSYNLLGLLAWDQSRLTQAEGLFQKTIETAQAAESPQYVYRPAGNLGSVYTQFGEFEKARDHLLEALGGAEAHDDTRTAGRVLTNLAVLELRIGDVPAALHWLERARAAAREAGDVTNEETIVAQLAYAHMSLGEASRAFALLDTALQESRRQGLRQAEAANLELQAGLYREAGDLRRSLNLYGRARAMNQQLGLREETGRDLRTEAEIHLSLGNAALAERYVSEALAMHREIEARPAVLDDLLALADVAEARGNRQTTDRHLGDARALVDAMRARAGRVQVAVAEARILDRRGQTDRVVRALQGIEGDLAFTGYGVEWEVHALRARALARMGQLDRAAGAGRLAVAAVERVRRNFASGVLRTTFVTDRGVAYGDLVAVLLRLGRTTEAFEVADAARGRALVEHGARGLAATEGPEGAEREMLLRRIEGLSSELENADRDEDETRAQELAGRLATARREFEEHFVHRAEATGPNQSGGAPTTDPSAVQAALRADEVLIEFLVTDDTMFTFVASRTAIRAFTVPASAEDLARRVRLARDLLADSRIGPEQAGPVLASLYHTLLGSPAEQGLLASARRLIIVPHGVLAYLPMAALRNAKTGRYLVQDYALLHLPVAAALPVLGRDRGEPVTDGSAPVAVAFAPLPGELPGSRREARAVRRAMGSAREVIGRRATEARLREALVGGHIAHVASHGIMNAASPLFSRIELAPGEGSSPDDDGRLEVHELLSLSIRSPLVFLSGCETGLGASWSTSFMAGEDYATLERAFLYAGARNVVATLWPVADAGAAEFARRFYAEVETRGPAEALAVAQQAMVMHERYSHPYYWAGYRVAGDGLTAAPQRIAAAAVQQ